MSVGIYLLRRGRRSNDGRCESEPETAAQPSEVQRDSETLAYPAPQRFGCGGDGGHNVHRGAGQVDVDLKEQRPASVRATTSYESLQAYRVFFVTLGF